MPLPAAWFSNHVGKCHRQAAAGCVGYGVDGGIRAVEQLRLVLAELHMPVVRRQVAVSLFEDVDDDGRFAPRRHLVEHLDAMLDQLVAWTGALRPLRSGRERALSQGGEDEGARPAMNGEERAMQEARLAVETLVAELQAGIDDGDADGRPLPPTGGTDGAFSETALYVLVRRGGAWWLAAGQNTPVRPYPPG